MKRLFLVFLPIILVSCVNAPKSRVSLLPIEAPENWKTPIPSGAFQSQNWIPDFNDPQLEAIINEALEHNYNLQAAEARLAAATAGSVAAGSSIWPSINLSGNQNKSRRSAASGIQQTPVSETFGVNARFNWEVDLWGKVRNGYKGDLADIQASQSDYYASRLSIAARVAKAWYAAIEANQQLDLARRTLEAFEQSKQIVEDNFKRGIARALDVRLIRANVASNRSSLEQRLRQRDAAIRNLETLLGRYPSNELNVAKELPNLNGEIPAGLPSELLLRRPDLLAAERRLAGAEQRKAESGKARFPSFSITANRGTSTREFDEILELSDRRVWSQVFNLTQPFFQGRRLQANYKRSIANYELALANYGNLALTAFREVEDALMEQSSFESDYESQKIATDESIAAEELAWEEYGRGLATITTVLDSVRRSISAQRSLIQVSNQRLQSRIDLYLALGGGFDFENSSTEN